jgi:membrane peptidoglycan carboxypeptidase
VALFLILMVAGVTVVSAGAIVVGGAAGVTLATLEEGLPDVRAFRDLDFAEATVLYDRKGKTELARFWEERREVVEFEDIPPLMLDATTATEDDTFWSNPGVDLEATINALVTEAGGGGGRGGGSTITQQLVRARLLPEDVIEAGLATKEGQYIRKGKEILQAYRLTQAFPGSEGKEEILTAYLNEISYGAAQGVAAAADIYLGKDLNELTLSEAALLAAIPQEPSNLYPWATNAKGKYANVAKEKVRGKRNKKGKTRTRLIIRDCYEKGGECTNTELVDRRNFILRRLRDGFGRWTPVSEDQYQEALREKIIIKPNKPATWQAPHFVQAVLPELGLILADRDPIKVGGYKVTTTLDMKAQRLAERYIEAGAVIPNLPISKYSAAIRKNKLGRETGWISKLRGLNLKNGAMVAQDYRTGDVLAYVGSAGYYKRETPKMNPKYDHVGQGHRQPGSAWKPILYATGIDTERLTAGTFLLDKREQFSPGWTPQNADRTYQGPIKVRDAIQKSLNIPAIRALQRVGSSNVRKYAVKAGFTFLNGNNKMLDQAGLAGALGTVEVRPLDMTAAFGAFGNGGKVTEPRYILKVEAPDGRVIYRAGKPITTQVWKPTTAYIMADILKGNTNSSVNPAWGAVFEMRNTRNGARREAAVKTGTTNQLKDYSTYGILPMPKKKNQPALAVGVWYGNSDSASPNLTRPIYSLDNAGRTWAAFVREYTKGKPAPSFNRPKGVVTGTTYGGGGSELYINGTQPGGKRQVDTSVPRAPAATAAPGSAGSNSGGGGSSTTTKPRGGGGGGNSPAPTCRPGTTDKPAGCVIPSN